MSDYRRLHVPGGTYFFTLVTYQRQDLFVEEARVEQLRQSLRVVKHKRPFVMIAGVVLPNHWHCIWSLPTGDADYSTRWQMIKTDFSQQIPAKTRQDGSKTVWQPRYFDHLIRDEDDFRRHLDYIHYNPVKHGFVATPGEWPHSSFKRFVAIGWYDKDWGNVAPPDVEDMDHE